VADAKSTQDTKQEAPRDFSAFLLDINKGQSHTELSEALAELVTEVQRTGKPGSITYTISVRPQAGDDTVVTVTDQIGRKLPKGERRSSLFFVDGADLVRNDPRQHALFGGRK
jgi:hypothetical protein